MNEDLNDLAKTKVDFDNFDLGRFILNSFIFETKQYLNNSIFNALSS